MVLPLLVGAAVASVLGFVLFSAATVLAHWTAVLAGIVVGGQTLRKLLEMNPFPLTNSETLNNIIYAGIAVGIAFVSFKIVQAVFATAGVLAAIIAALLIAGGWIFGFAAVASGVAAVLGGVVN